MSGALEILNRLLSPSLRLWGREQSAFQVCGVAGLAGALALGFVLAAGSGLIYGVLPAMAIAAVLLFLTLAAVTKAVAGEEKLIYYHHEIGILVAWYALLRLLGREPLPYLDAGALGLGVFLASGRLGCLMVGCCHGQPRVKRGIRYSRRHAQAGFPEWLVDVPLVPVQALEALLVAGVVAVGVWIVIRGAPAGTALGWYVSAYALVRFWLEFLRGDTVRPYLGGLSEAQWTSAGVAAAVAFAGHTGLLPSGLWRDVAACLLLAASLVMMARTLWQPASVRALLDPRQTSEIAGIVYRAMRPAQAGGITLGTTSRGYRISAGVLGGARHFTVSSAGKAITDAAAERLGRLFARVSDSRGAWTVIPRPNGVFHIVMHTRAPEPERGHDARPEDRLSAARL